MHQAKILIVEDEKDVVELIRYNLEKAGYQTDTALTGMTIAAALPAIAVPLADRENMLNSAVIYSIIACLRAPV